jgi:hypothetical protein
MFAAFGSAAGLRVLGLAGVNMSAKDPSGLFIVWGVPLVGIALCIVMIRYEIRPPSMPSLPSNPFKRSRAPQQAHAAGRAV